MTLDTHVLASWPLSLPTKEIRGNQISDHWRLAQSSSNLSFLCMSVYMSSCLNGRPPQSSWRGEVHLVGTMQVDHCCTPMPVRHAAVGRFKL